ncbi:unnamed protein product [Prunus armeniaca]|uniref:Uncharacterized protein n=1 Tax=Prunus armeniaca TaxID=36596 RepID=A0A6J5WJ61_PRUAR|nr:unnamed protein product [Prunus armeniaca]
MLISVSPSPLSLSLPDPAQPQPIADALCPSSFSMSSSISISMWGWAIRGGDLRVVEKVVGVGFATTSTSGCGEKSIGEGGSSVD